MVATKKRIDLSEKPEPVQRLAKLVSSIKDESGSMEKLGRTLDMTGAAIQKWCEGNLDDVLAIQVGNLKKLADYLGWTVDEMLRYLESGDRPIKKKSVGSPLSPEDKIDLMFELLKNLTTHQENNQVQEPRLNLSEREFQKLSAIFSKSLLKAEDTASRVASEAGLDAAKVTSVAYGDENLHIFKSELDKLAPYCFKPEHWTNLSPKLGESRFQSGDELLAAIRNGAPSGK